MRFTASLCNALFALHDHAPRLSRSFVYRLLKATHLPDKQRPIVSGVVQSVLLLAVVSPEEHAVDLLFVRQIADLHEIVDRRSKGLFMVIKSAKLAHDHGGCLADFSHLGCEKTGRSQIATEPIRHFRWIWRCVIEVDVEEVE